MIYLLILFSLLIASTVLAKDSGYQLEKSKVQAVVKEVMESQKDPRGKSSKLQALEEYEAFLLKHFEYKSDLKAEALHRLGDLYMQLEMNTHKKKLREYRDRLGLYLKGALSDRPPPPRIDHSKSILIYEEILKQYPDRDTNDAVLYQLARGYSDEGRTDEAIRSLNRLTSQFPKSPFRQEAYFRLGEFYFEMLDYKKAIQAYREAMNHPDEDFIDMTLYKMGWAYFAQEEYRNSIDTFVALLDRKTLLTQTGQRQLLLYNLPEKEGELLKEVVRTLLLAFDELGGPDRMTVYFREKGRRDYEDFLYRSLADLYLSQERYGEAESTLDRFVKNNPLHEEAPAVLANRIEILVKRKKVGQVLEAKEELIRSFGPGSQWFNQVSDSARLKVAPLLKQTAYDLALHHHAQAQRSRRTEDYEKAVEWSRQFLKDFPKEIEAAKVNFLLAEAYYELKRYDAAAEEYEKTAYRYPLHVHTQDAAYNLLLAREKLAGADMKHLGSAVLKYADRFPQDPRVPDLLLKTAQLAAQQRNYEAARDHARKLLTLRPQRSTQYSAQKLIATSYFDQKDYTRAAQELKALLTQAGSLQIPIKDQQELHTLLASSLYKQAEGLKQDGRLPEAVRGFLDIHNLAPQTEVAGIALFDGSVLLSSLGQTDEAILNFKKFLENYPRSSHQELAREHLASLYEKKGQFQEAIREYEKLADSALVGKNHPQAARWFLAMGNAAEQARDWQRAQKAFLAAIEKLPNGDEKALETLMKAAQATDKMGDPGKTQVLLGRILDQYRQQSSPTPRMSHLAAQASFILGEEKMKRYMEVRLTPPLEVSLEKKKRLLEESLEHYSRTVDFKIPEYITAATYRVGTLFEEFRNALLESERPRDLTPQQLEQYDFLLEEQAYPFEEKAISAYEANVRRAQEGGLYDEWIERSYRRLSQILPARYGRGEKAELVTREGLF